MDSESIATSLSSGKNSAGKSMTRKEIKLAKPPKKTARAECACQEHCLPRRDPYRKEEVYKLVHNPSTYDPFVDRNIVKEDIHSFLKCAIKERGYRLREKRTRIPSQRYRGDNIEAQAFDPSRLNKGLVRILRYLKPTALGPKDMKRPQIKPFSLEVSIPLIYPDLKEERYTDIQEILDRIFLPIEWVQNETLYIRQVSPYEATLQEVKDLIEYVDYRVSQCNMKNSGCCEGRYRFYMDVFDEVLRQETIACPERGLLLARIRDDLNTRIEVYKELFSESGAKLARILLMIEDGVDNITNEIETLQKENKKLMTFLNVRTVYYEEMMKDLSLLRIITLDRLTKDLKYYELYNEQLKKVVDELITYGKDEIYRDYE